MPFKKWRNLPIKDLQHYQSTGKSVTHSPKPKRYRYCHRKRKWVSDDIGNERLKGVGSVNRDSAIWQEFCEYHDIAYLLIALADLKDLLKMPVANFTLFSGWQGKSSEDAFVLADKVNKLIKKGYLQIPLKPSEIKKKQGKR